jgi:hypothetical protein
MGTIREKFRFSISIVTLLSFLASSALAGQADSKPSRIQCIGAQTAATLVSLGVLVGHLGNEVDYGVDLSEAYLDVAFLQFRDADNVQVKAHLNKMESNYRLNTYDEKTSIWANKHCKELPGISVTDGGTTISGHKEGGVNPTSVNPPPVAKSTAAPI